MANILLIFTGKRVLLFATILVPYACIQYYPLLFLSWIGGNGGMGCWQEASSLSASLLYAVEDRGETL